VAVDIDRGVIAHLNYKNGTSKEKFLIFLTLQLLPSLKGTGRRIFMFDNLSAHLTPEVIAAIYAEGHEIRRRPIHSPDFAPVESVFNFIDQFLHQHDTQVNDDNLHAYLDAALNAVRAADIKQFFAYSYFPVPGLPFTPYLGLN
jgi:hypothetical protein